MNRNANSRFAINPTNVDIQRSKFQINNSVKTSLDIGSLVPFYCAEVLPGDSFNIKTSKVVRLQTLLTPVMDNIYLDTYYFFVPNRLVWEHWKEFCGENNESAWVPETEYQIPQLAFTAGTGTYPNYAQSGSLADYFGIPLGVECSVNALPFRAYAKIVDDWFRDQNLQDPVNIPLGDATQYYSVTEDSYVNALANGGKPFIAAKFHDYFTSCLPAPQKGPDVMIPVADAGLYPVITGDNIPASAAPALRWRSTGGTVYKGAGNAVKIGHGEFAQSTVATGDTSGSMAGTSINPANLWADASGYSAATTINQLRLAFQVQKFYERAARGGTRYVEILKSFFGVTSPDARLQRSEYLGGNRVPININQVIQQSGTGAGSATPQGTTTGQSLTTDYHADFVKSFTEHGFVIGLMVARYDHTYQQGIERFWSRKNKFDYYWPVFAHIGEQAVLRKEIYADGTDADEEVFGYQEAWADYRYKPSSVTGEMRSNIANSLDVWHLADDYESTPYLSADWIKEDKANVDRTLAVTSSVSNQLFADLFIQNEATRPMPMFSIPGLIDHF